MDTLLPLFFLGVLFASPLAAADLPGPTIPEGLGVNIHFTTDHDADLDQIAAAGFRFVRMDLKWSETEKSQGEYDWSSYDGLTNALDKRGLRAIYILDYTHPLYESDVVDAKGVHGTAAPQRPESVAAFARWAGAAVRHFSGRKIVWEIWNEPNNHFWKPSPDAAKYTTLALATARAIREVDQQATILAPATSDIPWDYLDKVVTTELLALIDGVSVHPYRSFAPETVLPDYTRLRALIDSRAPEDKRNLPIISGEWGYQTSSRGKSLDEQGDYLAREFLTNLLAGVPLSIWYDWINDGTDPAYGEHNFGTVTITHQPKPSYEAMRDLTRELAGYHFVRREGLPKSEDYVLRFRNADNREKVACWTTGAAHTTTWGDMTLELGSRPKYLPVKNEAF